MGKRQREFRVQVFGYQEILSEFRTKGLDSRGGVQHIAVVGHFASEVSDFGGDDFSAVGGGLECGDYSVAFLELVCSAFQAFLEIVKAVDGSSLFSAVTDFPGQKGAVACNLVNFAVVFFAAVRKQPVVVPNVGAVLDMSQFFGNFGGTLHVDKHEYQVFFFGVLVLAEQGVHKNAGAELLVDRTDKGNQVPEQEQFENQNVRAGLFEYVQNVLHGGLVDNAFASVNVPNENAQRKVRTNARQEKPGADAQGRGYRSLVHFVLQDHDVVNGVRKSGQERQLQHVQHAG